MEQNPAMFCICCLTDDGPYINLSKCIHKDFLDTFFVPELPSLKKIVCDQCHAVLKKIKQFKDQVEENFNMLLLQARTLDIKKDKKKNIRISKVVHFNLPGAAENIDVQSENDTKIKNIEKALEIINNNSTSLQTLAVCNFKSITETLLQATTQNSNLERLVLPEAQSVLNHEVEMLSVDIKEENIELVEETSMLQEENKSDSEFSDASTVSNEEIVNDENNQSFMTVNIKNNSKLEVFVHKSKNTSMDKTLLTERLKEEISNPEMTVLTNKSETDIIIDRLYGTAVLPDMKVEPDDVASNSLIQSVSATEVHDSCKESSKNEDPQPSPSLPALKYIKLSKEELMEDRKSKLNSKEYLSWLYKCNHCLIGFKYKDNLNDHIKRKHQMKDGCVSCEICQQYVTKEAMPDHMFRHYNRIKCDKCKEHFVLYDEAQLHFVQAHAPGKPQQGIKRTDNKSRKGKRRRTDNGPKIGEINPSHSTRKRRGEAWSEDNMKAAMKAVQRGHLTQRSAVAKYNIPRRTLRDHLKTGQELKRLGRKPILTNKQEEELASRINRFASIGIPLTPKFIRKQAFLFCERYDIKNNFNQSKRIAGVDWLRYFLKRNPSIKTETANNEPSSCTKAE